MIPRPKPKKQWTAAGAFVILNAVFSALLALLPLLAAPVDSAQKIFSRVEDSVFTVEVHTGHKEAKSVLGSGYLVSNQGDVITNYHVVSAYVNHPDRYQIRLKNSAGQYPAKLIHFDLINDLAWLHSPKVSSKPLSLSPVSKPKVGTSIFSLGNPHGLRMSIIRGLFNGHAEKGLINRMLFSMPLNSGMSGGPILDARGRVMGTNVSVIWLSNNVSFGVPKERVPDLLARTPLPVSEKAYRKEIHRQFQVIEARTFKKVKDLLETSPSGKMIAVGGAELTQLPKIFACWDSSKHYEEQGLRKARYSCNLQFTPLIGDLGAVASIEIFVEHVETKRNAYGFYGYLEDHGDSHHRIFQSRRFESVRTDSHCTSERVRENELEWKMNTCVNAYIDYDDLYEFSVAGTTLSRPKEAIHFTFHMRGFQKTSFMAILKHFLQSLRFKA